MVYGTSTIKVEIGLKIGDTTEYILMGIYNIDDIEKTDYTIKITAFDNMIKFETPYFSTLGDTPTLQQVVNELSSKTGVQFVGSLPAYNVKKLEGFTCREILGYVASLCGGNAVITRDGKFTIVTPKDNSYSIGTANYIDYKREETKYKIGKVSCQAGEEVLSKGSLGADSMELQFENPWINATILTDIYNKLNGFEYLGYSMKWQGDLSLDVGDIVTITDKKGVVRKHPILSQKFTYTGGLTSEISAKGENKNKNEFSSSGPSAKKVERVVMELALINKTLIDVAYIGDLTANNIKFDTASGGTLDLQSLLVKFVSGENGQYLNLTSSNVVIDNAVIKDAMIDTISASKINTGVLDTNLVTVQGPSGNLLIKDNTIQIKDANRTRVQIGKDASNDYNMYVWDSTGKLMFDATGLKADGIKSKIIRDDMISDTANINGAKINISSLITEVNKDTNTQVIKASKVAFDSTGQSLEVSFNSLKSNVDSKESRNLFIQSIAISGKYLVHTDGTLGDSPSHTASDYIGISPNEFYTLSSSKLFFNLRYVFYDEKKQYISGDLILNGISTKIAKSPSNAKYIRFSSGINTSNKDNWKIEKGENTNPIYSLAPEDIEEKIQANTTAIKVEQGRVNVLVNDSTIIKGDITTLKDNYTTIDATVNGLKTTVSSHTTSITNAQNTANNANTLADSKAKVFTSTPTTPYKTGDIWAGGPSGEIMKCKVARATGSYVAADWEKASKYTDDTKANAVEVNLNNLSAKVTTVETKQATLEQNIEGFKTTVSSTYSTKTELNTLNDTVTVVEQRVNTVEQNITATAITTTISSAINAGTSSITTTQFIMDKNGLAIKNGALTIKNKAGATVLTADTDGNLFVQNTLTVGGNTNGNIQLKNASNVNTFTVSKDGVFLKDGIMKVTSGNVNWDGITYPEASTRDMIVYAYGTSIEETELSGSQIYKKIGRYFGSGIGIIEDNRGNAQQSYFETLINARGITTPSLTLGAFLKSTNGYAKINDGFLIQWGFATITGSQLTITLPLPYSSRQVTTQVTVVDTSITDNVSAWLVGQNLTTITIRVSKPCTVEWLSFGY